jgi:hypothetical protein
VAILVALAYWILSAIEGADEASEGKEYPFNMTETEQQEEDNGRRY